MSDAQDPAATHSGGNAVMPPVTCAAKAFPTPQPHLTSSSLLRQTRQSPVTMMSISQMRKLKLRDVSNLFNILQSRSNRIVFSTYVQTCAHFEGKVRGYWRGKPAPLSLTSHRATGEGTSGSRVRGLGSQSLLNMKEQTQSFSQQLHTAC